MVCCGVYYVVWWFGCSNVVWCGIGECGVVFGSVVWCCRVNLEPPWLSGWLLEAVHDWSRSFSNTTRLVRSTPVLCCWVFLFSEGVAIQWGCSCTVRVFLYSEGVAVQLGWSYTVRVLLYCEGVAIMCCWTVRVLLFCEVIVLLLECSYWVRGLQGCRKFVSVVPVKLL